MKSNLENRKFDNRKFDNQLLERDRRSSEGRFSWMRPLWNSKGVALLLGCGVALLTACETVERPVAEAPAGVQPNVQAGEVANQTAQLVGKTVTVRSRPIRKIAEPAFTITSEQFFGRDPILVINATGQPFVLPTNGNVEIQATGTVRNFVLVDIEREYGLDLDPNLYAEFENQPAIIAQSLAQAPEPGQITQNPQRYYNQRLAVTGEVENIGNNTFTLDEDRLFGAQDLLVLNRTTGAKAVTNNETVAVTGVLRPFVVAELEREYDFNWDQGFVRQLEAEYSNRPVLIADSVYPSAIPE